MSTFVILIMLSWCRVELEKIVGHPISVAYVQKAASQARRLYLSQPVDHGVAISSKEQVNGLNDDVEFGADIMFHAPSRFLIDVPLEDVDLVGEEASASQSSASFHYGWYEDGNTKYNQMADDKSYNLSWLRDLCEVLVRDNSSALSRDELAMTICRVLDSDKPGEEVLKFSNLFLNFIGVAYKIVQLIEVVSSFFSFLFFCSLKIAADLLDLVGDSAFETVQDIIMVNILTNSQVSLNAFWSFNHLAVWWIALLVDAFCSLPTLLYFYIGTRICSCMMLMMGFLL